MVQILAKILARFLARMYLGKILARFLSGSCQDFLLARSWQDSYQKLTKICQKLRLEQSWQDFMRSILARSCWGQNFFIRDWTRRKRDEYCIDINYLPPIHHNQLFIGDILAQVGIVFFSWWMAWRTSSLSGSHCPVRRSRSAGSDLQGPAHAGRQNNENIHGPCSTALTRLLLPVLNF